MDIEYREAKLEEILALRHAVLRPGLPAEAAHFHGDEEATTRHFAAVSGAEVAGCLSMMLNSFEGEPAWQLRGMATAPAWRGKGAGAKLLAFAEQTLRDGSNVRLFWCNARSTAVEFYKKQGWEVASGEFMIEGVGPHFRMSKIIPPCGTDPGSGLRTV